MKLTPAHSTCETVSKHRSPSSIMTGASHLYEQVGRLHFWEGHLQVLDDFDATGLIDTNGFDFRGIRHGINESQSWLRYLSRELNGWHPYFIRVITDRQPERWQLASLNGSKGLHCIYRCIDLQSFKFQLLSHYHLTIINYTSAKWRLRA